MEDIYVLCSSDKEILSPWPAHLSLLMVAELKGEDICISCCLLSLLGFIATMVVHGWYTPCANDLICQSKSKVGLVFLKKKNCF